MHILLIEDDLDLGTSLQRALGTYGLSSEWVRGVQHARALADELRSGQFACVLLDLGLQDGEGLDLLRSWRRADIHVPVMVVTARDALQSRVDGLDAGADDYVVKPVAPLELASRVRAITRRLAGQASSEWTIGRLQIDTARYEVRFDGELVMLSPKEYAILLELARHAGEVVAKHRVARAVSPLNEPLEFNALEWHIHNLRRKLGEQAICTVRGVGYRLGEAP